MTPSLHSYRALLVLIALTLATASAPAQQKPAAFLLYKPGDPGATVERAKGFLEEFATYLGRRVTHFEKARVAGQIANTKDLALHLLDETRPTLALVPVGFYLEHLRDPKFAAQIVASVPRFGTAVERYYLVAAADAGPTSLTALRGKCVRSAAEIDWPYLQRAVFPKGSAPPVHFKLEPSTDLADDVFSMVEPDDHEPPPAALLLDEGLRAFFADDDLVWPHLKVIWTSPPLPRDLVITLGDGWSDDERTQLLSALIAMNKDKSGKRLLELMQSDGFAKPDRPLLQRTTEAYDRKPDAPKQTPAKKR